MGWSCYKLSEKRGEPIHRLLVLLADVGIDSYVL